MIGILSRSSPKIKTEQNNGIDEAPLKPKEVTMESDPEPQQFEDLEIVLFQPGNLCRNQSNIDMYTYI